MSWTKVLRCVMTASAMSRPILEQVGAIVPLRAQQVVVPVLAVGLCYEVESDVLRMLVYYILSLMSVNSPADSVLRAAFCHYPENYITLMEYYDPAEHGMEAYTRKIKSPEIKKRGCCKNKKCDSSLHKGIAQNQKPGTLLSHWP